MATTATSAAEASETLAPSVFVRQSGEDWELVERESDAVLSTHATKNEALDAALAELGSPLKGALLKDEKTHEAIGVWRWHDATAEMDESDGTTIRITRDAIESMASKLNGSSIPKPVDGGKVPADHLPSEVHGSYDDSATPANGWAHAGVPWLDGEGRMHLALKLELLPVVAREMDRGRLAYGSVHVEGEDVDETGGIIGAELESHGLTNRPVVQGLVPSSAMLTRDRRAVVTLRSKRGSMATKNAKVVTLKGPALDALSAMCATVGLSLDEEMGEGGDSWVSPLCDRIRALKQLAVGEQTLEAIGKGGADAEPDAAIAAARKRHIARIAQQLSKGVITLAEGDTTDAATQAVAALQAALGLDSPEAVLTWIDAHKDELAAMATETEVETEDGVTSTKSRGGKGGGVALSLALKKIEALEAEATERREREIEAQVEADVAAGKIATADRAAYLELAKSNPKLYATLTKNARAVPTGMVTSKGKAPGTTPAGEVDDKAFEASLSDSERAKVTAMKAAKVSKQGIRRAIERARAEG